MTVREVATTTMLWVRDVSTNVFVAMGKRLLKSPFARRNTRRVGIALLIWLIASVVLYLVLVKNLQNEKSTFYTVGSSQTQDLAEEIGQALLENDILALKAAMAKIANNENFLFAAIVDHQEKVVASTDSELVNHEIPSLEGLTTYQTIEGISIQEGISADGQEIVTFSDNVNFAGVKIGFVYVGLSAYSLKVLKDRQRTFFALGMFLGLFVLLAVLTMMARLSRPKVPDITGTSEGTKKMGPYLLQKKLGHGGMAELFVASYERQDGFRKVVAVKRVLPHLADNPEFINMFIREARLAAQLQHPNVVQTIDFGKIGDAYFIAMEYVRGRNLAEIVAKVNRGLDFDQVVFIASGVAAGLEYSRTIKDERTGTPLEIVHRDVSPQNILISFQGEVKISDFGISKATSEVTLTEAGVIKGKLSYLSPEQALGQKADHRSDLYALGIVIYEMLSGKRLHNFTTDIEAIRTIPEKDVLPIKELRTGVPDELNRIVMKCLERDKTLRYQTAKELLQDLTAFKYSLSVIYDSAGLAEFMTKHFRQTLGDYA